MVRFPRRLNGADVWGVRLAHTPPVGTDSPPPRLSGLGVMLWNSKIYRHGTGNAPALLLSCSTSHACWNRSLNPL